MTGGFLWCMWHLITSVCWNTGCKVSVVICLIFLTVLCMNDIHMTYIYFPVIQTKLAVDGFLQLYSADNNAVIWLRDMQMKALMKLLEKLTVWCIATWDHPTLHQFFESLITRSRMHLQIQQFHNLCRSIVHHTPKFQWSWTRYGWVIAVLLF